MFNCRFIENPPVTNHRVQFLNDFLFFSGPEGLGRKNFKIETQCNEYVIK